MTDPDAEPTRRDLAHAAARTSDAAADLLASLTGMGRAVQAAHTAGHPVAGISRVLIQGQAQARYRRARALIRPSLLLAECSAEVINAAAAAGLFDVRIFGSCARGEDTRCSDVDLIISTGPHTSLLDITRFVVDVADLVGLPEDRVDVFEDQVLRGSSDLGARIAAEIQPLGPWAAAWPRLDSLPGWAAACAAAASEEELIEVAESGLHPWGETSAALRNLPAGRPAGATLVDPGELVRVTAVLAAYAAGIAAGLPHDAALTRAVTSPRPV